MINWSLQKKSLKDLKDHSKNPRKISKEQKQKLEQLIEKFGLIDKPVINCDDTIIGGHQRIKILKKMGTKECDCWLPDHQLSDEEINHLCIGLNLNQGEWDDDILMSGWDPIDLLKFGFSEEQLDKFTKEHEKILSEITEEENEILEPAKDEDSITKLGDLFELDGHRLICGDSTNPETVKKVMAKFIPNLLLTDPPYGVNYDPSWRKNIKGREGVAYRAGGIVKNDDQSDWSIAYSLFPGNIAYVWHGAKHSHVVAQNLIDNDFEIVSQIIWNKQHFAMSRGDYHWKHEPCWYAVRKGANHQYKGDRKQTTVWDIANLNCFGKSKEEDERTAHSTQKPIECMARPIRHHTEPDEYIYDPFLGSGTTLIAAEKLRRKCIGIELSPAYCDIIIKRWIKERKKNGKPAKVLKNGNICTDFEENL